MYDEIVSLVVGEEKRVFTIHKGVLCSTSTYFAAALKGSFKEAAEQKIIFPEGKPWVFERFQLWLYSKQVLDEGESPSSIRIADLVTLYSFAESRIVPELQNHLVDLLLRKCKVDKVVLAPDQGDMYTILAPLSPLRKLTLDMAAHRGASDENSLIKYPKEYLVELICALRGLRDMSNPKKFWDVRCEYHVHAEGEPQCAEDTEDEQE